MTVIILRQLVFLAVQDKTSLIDPVTIASDQSSEITTLVGDIIGDRTVGQHDVTELAVPVGYPNRNDTTSVVRDRYLYTIFVFQFV